MTSPTPLMSYIIGTPVPTSKFGTSVSLMWSSSNKSPFESFYSHTSTVVLYLNLNMVSAMNMSFKVFHVSILQFLRLLFMGEMLIKKEKDLNF